jgi:hypothetical protein
MTCGVSRTSVKVKDLGAVLEALSKANSIPVAEDPDMKQAIIALSGLRLTSLPHRPLSIRGNKARNEASRPSAFRELCVASSTMSCQVIIKSKEGSPRDPIESHAFSHMK